MKKRKRKHKGVGGLIVAGVILAFLNGCSTTQNMFGSLPFSDYSNIKTGLSDKDLAGFGQSIRAARGNPESHYLLARYYQERGKHKEAIEELEKTISIAPAYVKAYNRIGISYDKLGYFSRALDYYKNALALNPELDYVLNNLGYSYILQGRYDEAVKFLKKAVDLKKNNKVYRNNLGLAYAMKQKFEKTIDEFSVAVKREAAYYDLKRMLSESNAASESEKTSSHDVSSETSSEMITTGIDSAKSMHEAKHSHKNRETTPDLNRRIVFGKPIFLSGTKSADLNRRIVFGKPIFLSGAKSADNSSTSGKQPFFTFVRKLFRVFDKGSNKA